MEIDETDKKILNILIENSKLSLREIAKKIGLSAVTVLKRIKELERNSIIKNYSINLDYEKLGYDISVVLQIRISHGKLFEVEKKIAIHQNVFAVYDITGSFDSLVIAKFKTRKSMDLFLKKIQTYDFVERTETLLVLNTVKENNIIVE